MKNDEKISGNFTIESENGKYNINISRVGLMKAGAYSTFGSVLVGTSLFAVYKMLRWAFGKMRERLNMRKPLQLPCDVDHEDDTINMPKKRGRSSKRSVLED